MSLTSRLDKTDDPIRLFFLERFPNTRPLINDMRAACDGAETIRPETSTPWSLLGHAIDYRIRGYFAPVSLHGQPELGIQGVWSGGAGWELRERIGFGLERQARELNTVGRRLDRNEEEWVARLCLVLSMFEVYARSGQVVAELQVINPQGLTADQLLNIPEPHWVDDLSAMSWAFYESSRNFLKLPVVLNPVFDGSMDVGGADADLILGHCLVDIKATINLKRIDRLWVYQLLGYLLLDYSNTYDVESVGFYMARQARYVRWRLDEFLSTLAGQQLPPVSVLRDEFKRVASG